MQTDDTSKKASLPKDPARENAPESANDTPAPRDPARENAPESANDGSGPKDIMREKRGALVLTLLFSLLLCGIAIWQICLPDLALSDAERRSLKQQPSLTVSGVMDGSYFSDLEGYLLDQFPARQGFRTINAALRFYGYAQKEVNGVYLAGDSAGKLLYPLNETGVATSVKKLRAVMDRYLSESKCYLAIIPDKNYYLAAEHGQLCLDYERMFRLLEDGLSGMEAIDLTGALNAACYYRTDTHWRQTALTGVVLQLAGSMDFTPNLPERTDCYSPFYGVLYGQSALPLTPDTICYLNAEWLGGVTVTNYETGKTETVYQLDKAAGMDAYDLFLGGASALLTIENPNANSEQELIVFRDSFFSSLAPLLIGSYQKITLVDLRYIHPDLLGNYIDFHGQTVLFALSTLVLNDGSVLK